MKTKSEVVMVEIDDYLKGLLESQYRYVNLHCRDVSINDYLCEALLRGFNNMNGFLGQGKNVYVPNLD